jgi:hypothetical protein
MKFSTASSVSIIFCCLCQPIRFPFVITPTINNESRLVMNLQMFKCVLLATLVGLFSASASADPGDRIENRLDKKGDRIENRLDNRGDRVNDRLDMASDRADANGKQRLAGRLDRRGDRVDHRLDRKGSRIDHRLDRKGQRINRRH